MPDSFVPSPQKPAYLVLHESGELARRAEKGARLLAGCALCPRACGADRLAGEIGFCGGTRQGAVASSMLHFGEETPLVGAEGSGSTGREGSGTIFFAGCNLGCAFCQNHDISDPASAREPVTRATAEQLAAAMLDLQERGAHNINFVTPSHMVVQILEGLVLAADKGLTLPLVYNTSGYDAPFALRLLDGVIDIYMPDVKFWDADVAARLCRGASDYPAVARAAVTQMHRQVGDLVLDKDGIAVRGLLVRHLVLPNGLAGTREWMRFLARDISTRTYVNLMDQYRPCAQAHAHSDLSRPLTAAEMDAAMAMAMEQGVTRLDRRHDRLAARLFAALARP